MIVVVIQNHVHVSIMKSGPMTLSINENSQILNNHGLMAFHVNTISLYLDESLSLDIRALVGIVP